MGWISWRWACRRGMAGRLSSCEQDSRTVPRYGFRRLVARSAGVGVYYGKDRHTWFSLVRRCAFQPYERYNLRTSTPSKSRRMGLGIAGALIPGDGTLCGRALDGLRSQRDALLFVPRRVQYGPGTAGNAESAAGNDGHACGDLCRMGIVTPAPAFSSIPRRFRTARRPLAQAVLAADNWEGRRRKYANDGRI